MKRSWRGSAWALTVLWIGVALNSTRGEDVAGPSRAAPQAIARNGQPQPAASVAEKPEEKGKAKPGKRKSRRGEASPDPAATAGHEKTAASKPVKAEAATSPSLPSASAKKPTVVKVVLEGDLPEGPTGESLFGEPKPSLSAVIRRLDRAAEDKAVAAVLLEIEDVEAGAGKVEELRAAIARLRKAGKLVYAQLSGADTHQYLIAIACDEVAMVPSGMLMVPGVRAEVTFFKGLLDKLGLQFDSLQMGKYKGAAETFTRAQMSPDLRESWQAIVDDRYERLIQTVAGDRKLPAAKVKSLVDQGLFTAEAAQKAGLVDRMAYGDEFCEALRTRLKAEALNLVTEEKKSAETELSGISGLMKMMELTMGRKSADKSTPGRKIAVVYAVGTIMDGESSSSLLGEQVLGGRTLASALKTAAEDPKVLAIVLRIDSPGGSAVASDLVWRTVRQIKKPVIASMGDVAASGGYYIAMGTSQIFAEPGTLTGSIGVVGGKLVTGGLYGKVGITTEVISRGKNSGTLSSMQPFTSEEREAWTALLRETYRQFVDKAAQGRKMSRDQLEKLAQGRVYTGAMASTNGLVDRLGTLQDAVAEAKKAAGLKPDEKIELLILPRPKSFFEQLFGDSSMLSERVAAALPAGAEILGQLHTLRRLFAEPALTLMPYRARLK